MGKRSRGEFDNSHGLDINNEKRRRAFKIFDQIESRGSIKFDDKNLEDVILFLEYQTQMGEDLSELIFKLEADDSRDNPNILHNAVLLGNIDFIARIISLPNGCEFLSAVDSRINNPLHDAIFYDNANVVKIILAFLERVYDIGGEKSKAYINDVFYAKGQFYKDCLEMIDYSETGSEVIELVKNFDNYVNKKTNEKIHCETYQRNIVDKMITANCHRYLSRPNDVITVEEAGEIFQQTDFSLGK